MRGASRNGLRTEHAAEGPSVDPGGRPTGRPVRLAFRPVLDASGENFRIQLKTFLFHFFKFISEVFYWFRQS